MQNHLRFLNRHPATAMSIVMINFGSMAITGERLNANGVCFQLNLYSPMKASNIPDQNTPRDFIPHSQRRLDMT